MEAKQVIDKIMSDARDEAEEIKKQAREKEAAELAKLNEQLDQYKKQTGLLAEKAGSDEKSHILAKTRMEIARQYLAEKRKILEEVFEQAHQQLLDLDDEQYRTFCTKLLLDAVETGDDEVIIDPSEPRIDQDFIKQVNRELGPGYRGNLRLSDERQNMGGGFILRRGKIKTNVSIKVMLDQARRELEIDLAKHLFENE
jgi:V/A-type H+-transporting ATPase subunit E